MKIKVGTYCTKRYNKKDTRLTIPIRIEDAKGNVMCTSAVVQMNPIARFWGKSPSLAFSLGHSLCCGQKRGKAYLLD